MSALSLQKRVSVSSSFENRVGKWMRRPLVALLTCCGWVAAAGGDVWSLRASVETIRFNGVGTPVETNRVKISGTTDGERFLITTDAVPRYCEETHYGWDGETLRWYRIMSDGPAPFQKNALSSERYVRPVMERTPLGREASRPLHCLAMALLTPLELQKATSKTNSLRLETSLHIPEMFSAVTITANEKSGRVLTIIAHATNWVWVSEGLAKTRKDLPSPLDKGFKHWEFSVTKDDPANGLPAEFQCKRHP